MQNKLGDLHLNPARVAFFQKKKKHALQLIWEIPKKKIRNMRIIPRGSHLIPQEDYFLPRIRLQQHRV
jgi:hypothetical protein